MKNALLFLLLGGIIGAYALHYYQTHESVLSRQQIQTDAGDAGARAEADAGSARDAMQQHLAQWHLTPDDIRADLARTGQVVRSKMQAAGGRIADVRIVAVIKAKYVLDRNLSASSIEVHADAGAVTLDGSVPSPDLIGQAVALALETDGVATVTSRLTVR